MRGGALRNKITIQEKSVTRDPASNEEIVAWTTFREVYCEVLPRRGAEFFENAQRYSQTYYRFRARFGEIVGLDTSMRILFEGQAYDIRNNMPDLQMHADCVIEATLQDGVV